MKDDTLMNEFDIDGYKALYYITNRNGNLQPVEGVPKYPARREQWIVSADMYLYTDGGCTYVDPIDTEINDFMDVVVIVLAYYGADWVIENLKEIHPKLRGYVENRAKAQLKDE